MCFEYNILFAGIDMLELLIPEGFNILSVNGEGVNSWRQQHKGEKRILYVHLDYDHKGFFSLNIEYEKTLLETSNKFSERR